MAHSEEIRATVQAALLAGLGISETARRYRLPKSTVHLIKSQLSAEQLDQAAGERKEAIADLLLSSIRVHIEAVNTIAVTCSERDYLRKQGAADVALLHGKIADYAVRLLEAASAAWIEEAQ